MKKIYLNLFKDVSILFSLVILSISLIVWIIQAVNYLDFVSEDGHNFFTYFKYTFFTFPKIINNIFMFTFFISFFYIIVTYENKNYWNIFWSNGIKKTTVTKVFLSISFFFLIINLIISVFINPNALNKARLFITSSKINLFSSIKQQTFNDVVSNFTIYISEKNSNNELVNIIIKEGNDSESETKTIYAKKGVAMEKNGIVDSIRLFNGSIIINRNNKITNFNFDTVNYDLSKYKSKTTSYLKVQELKSGYLFKCILKIKIDFFSDMKLDDRCKDEFFFQGFFELIKRIIKSFYLPAIAGILSFLLFCSQNQKNYVLKRNIIFLLGFLILIIYELSSSLDLNNIIYLYMYICIPIILFVFSILATHYLNRVKI